MMLVESFALCKRCGKPFEGLFRPCNSLRDRKVTCGVCQAKAETLRRRAEYKKALAEYRKRKSERETQERRRREERVAV